MGVLQRLARNFTRFVGGEPDPHDRGAEIYLQLRNAAFNATPEELRLRIEREDTPFGVLMEQDHGGQTATLTAFATGDASLYFSTGGGMIGGAGHESIAAAAKQSVEEADHVLDLMRPVTDFFRPSGDDVYFYVLTRGDYISHMPRDAPWKILNMPSPCCSKPPILSSLSIGSCVLWNTESKDLANAILRSAEPHAVGSLDKGPLDEDWVLDHRVEHFVVSDVRACKAKLLR